MRKIKENRITKVTHVGQTGYSWQCPECNYVKNEEENPHIGDKIECRNKKCGIEFEVVKSN